MRNGIRPDFKKDNVLVSSSIRRSRVPSKVTLPLFPLTPEGRYAFSLSSRTAEGRSGIQPLDSGFRRNDSGFSSPAGDKHLTNLPNSALKIREGEHVLAGQVLAEAASPELVNTHATISGYAHITANTVEIESDKRDDFIPGYGVERPGWNDLKPEELLAIFQRSGLVQMDPSIEPLHLSLNQQKHSGIHTLVINGCESEPYVTSRQSLMMAHAIEIVRGAEILRKVLGVERVVIATEDNKLEAAELLRSKIYFLKWPHFNVRVFPARYPQEFEDILQQEFLIGEKGTGKGAVIYDVAAAYAVYEAVALQKPLIERAVTIAGECVIEPANLWLRLGTSFADAIKNCRGLLREPGVILAGGPMRGTARENLELPINAGVQAVLALPKEIVKPDAAEPCIRCGFCLDACPVEISPAMITLAGEHEQFHAAYDYGIELCNRCGSCSYVCPSKRPMLELIDYAWQKIQAELEPKYDDHLRKPAPTLKESWLK